MKKKCASALAIFLIFTLLAGCRVQKPLPSLPTPTPAAKAAATPTQSQPAESAGQENYLLVEPENPETPAPTLKSEAGTLPEEQPFKNYTSAAGGYDVQAPENWKPDATGPDVQFIHGYSGIEVRVIKTTEAFTLDIIKGVQVADLVRTGRAVDVREVSMVSTKSYQAVYVEYESNSEPVDGKKVRLANHRYYFNRGGLLAVLTLWAPVGADNENIWKQIPDTFYWR